MIYYEAKAKTVGYTAKNCKKPRYVCRKTSDFNLFYDEVFTFLYRFDEQEVRVGIISDGEVIDSDVANEFLAEFSIKHELIELDEIDSHTMGYLLGGALKKGYLAGDVVDDKIRNTDLSNRSYSRLDLDFWEYRVDIDYYQRQEIPNYLKSLKAEVERINKGATVNMKGHPVHYMVQIDDLANTHQIVDTLITALYLNKRINSKMYVGIEIKPQMMYDTQFKQDYLKICQSFLSKALVTRFVESDNFFDEAFLSSGGDELIENIAETMTKYRNKLLNIIILPKVSQSIKRKLLDRLESICFIELSEDLLTAVEAKEYLVNLAQYHELVADDKLINTIIKDQSFYPSDLSTNFENWYSYSLKKIAYPQYDFAKTNKEVIVKAKPLGSAYEQLTALIGLNQIKTIINETLDYNKAKRLFKDANIDFDNPVLHMVFRGNPGTAKTTVARLFAKIMRENKILSEGHLVEVGRADLVGKYVGQTAPLVEKAFKRARGGILFIDEAYSLVDDRVGLYGDEALNTIVQEMENNRDNLIVIFAGYPQKMQEFIDRNPGLKSRIAYNVEFDDYSTPQLCEIIQMIAEKNKLKIEKQAMKRIKQIFDNAIDTKDFGNGRYARNIFEKARIKQASRLVKMDVNNIHRKDIKTLVAEDFEMPIKKSHHKTLGFGGN